MYVCMYVYRPIHLMHTHTHTHTHETWVLCVTTINNPMLTFNLIPLNLGLPKTFVCPMKKDFLF